MDDPGPQEVQVELRASGICHTDADGVRIATRRFVLVRNDYGASSAYRIRVGDQPIHVTSLGRYRPFETAWISGRHRDSKPGQ